MEMVLQDGMDVLGMSVVKLTYDYLCIASHSYNSLSLMALLL